MSSPFFAHTTEGPEGEWQKLSDHLIQTADLAARHAGKIGLSKAGRFVGLLHDIGKYSHQFQRYLREEENSGGDHSTAGAQWVWNRIFPSKKIIRHLCGQVLALSICSHHSPLIDCLGSDGDTDGFSKRMEKGVAFDEVVANAREDGLLEEAEAFFEAAIEEIKQHLLAIQRQHTGSVPHTCQTCPIAQKGKCRSGSPITAFQFGLATRFLYSCLIDADRTDTASLKSDDIENSFPGWSTLIDQFEVHLAGFTPRSPIDETRNRISNLCRNRAEDDTGLFSLTVPTGGGKTLSTLRFALHHAQKHDLERIIYVIPYTSIIDQNASEARKILEAGAEPGSIVLEHHSNLDPGEESEEALERDKKNRKRGENWDAPVVFTTMVQFLEALFGSRTSSARRMHRLARSVIIFDEIQTLPVRCVHLFNNALNHLTCHCGSSAILCTATQPLLGKVDSEKGALPLSPEKEIIPDIPELFQRLKRVELHNLEKNGGWSLDDVTRKVLRKFQENGSCLVVVNTKSWARNLYLAVSAFLHERDALFHLSTDMCPVHRMAILKTVRSRLPDPKHPNRPVKPVLCISTQLIEAGVDISFASVIRFAAGMDSILQAAGRCNRNMEKETGDVFIVNPDPEPIQMLPDIEIGKRTALRVLNEFEESPDFNGDLSDPRVMAQYFAYAFHERTSEMAYPVSVEGVDRTLFQLLSCNPLHVGHTASPTMLRQSFATASRAFASIDSPTQGVIVSCNDEAKTLIAELCSAYAPERQKGLLRKAQRYSVNVFPNRLRKLREAGALNEIGDSGIFYLDSQFYSADFGLSDEIVSQMDGLFF